MKQLFINFSPGLQKNGPQNLRQSQPSIVRARQPRRRPRRNAQRSKRKRFRPRKTRRWPRSRSGIRRGQRRRRPRWRARRTCSSRSHRRRYFPVPIDIIKHFFLFRHRRLAQNKLERLSLDSPIFSGSLKLLHSSAGSWPDREISDKDEKLFGTSGPRVPGVARFEPSN